MKNGRNMKQRDEKFSEEEGSQIIRKNSLESLSLAKHLI